MAVSYFAEDVKMPAIKKRETTDWIRRVASGYGKKCGDIAYIFCSDEKILEVNKAYLQHDYYTDVITFDYTEGDKIVPMRNSSEPIMTKSFIGLSYTVFCICAVSTIKARESVR